MWRDQLFAMLDGNHDKKVTLCELIIACSPDVNNDGQISDKEFEMGRRTAVFWLANIVAATPSALQDNEIDLHELYEISQCGASVPSKDHVSDATNLLAGVSQ